MAEMGDVQRFLIGGQVYAVDDDALQQALAAVHDTSDRPRCLCRGGGIEMYVALHRRYVVKRMAARCWLRPHVSWGWSTTA